MAAATTNATTTAELLNDRGTVVAAHRVLHADGGAGRRVEDLELLSPVTSQARVVAQMVNYRSHARDSGFNPDSVPPTFFLKSSDSIAGPFADIRRPPWVALLDYEVELGLVIGADLALDTTVTDADLTRYVAGLVVTNDLSARDVQLVQGQFYEAKSYPTFTPVGPRLVLLEPGEAARLKDLRLRLSVNGVLRQDRTAEDMIVEPARALTLLARFQSMRPGDLLLTGTPGGTALKAPARVVEKIGALLPPQLKWSIFFRAQARVPAYLRAGDLVTTTIATPDLGIDLGEQRNRVVDA